MRPDQHKKKQSAAYKKKHGIKDSDVKGAKGEKNIPTKGKPETSQNTKLKSENVGPAERKYVDLPEFSSSDDDLQSCSHRDKDPNVKESRGVVQPGKRFQKRQIVSNWSRYEGQQGEGPDETTKLRGADFSQLLQSAGDALSQFRFKDEEDWDGQVEDSAVFALDVNDLAQAVKCVPLHERLNIDGHHFPPSMTRRFEEDSHKYSLLYGQSEESEPHHHAITGQNSLDTSQTEIPSHVPNIADILGVNSKSNDNLEPQEHSRNETKKHTNSFGEDGVDSLPTDNPAPAISEASATAKKTESPNTQNMDPASDDLEDWLDSVI